MPSTQIEVTNGCAGFLSAIQTILDMTEVIRSHR